MNESTFIKLRQWLQERGISVPRGGKHMSTMRLWLEKDGVLVSGYRVDQARLNEILGIAIEEFEALAVFSPQQRAYLKALANIDGGGPHPSNDIERLAAATYGVTFNEKNLPKQVLYPLKQAGYIELERGTKKVGRGAKPFLVTATGKLEADVIAPLIEQIEHLTHADLRPLLRKSLRDTWTGRADRSPAAPVRPTMRRKGTRRHGREGLAGCRSGPRSGVEGH
ncbi:MAG: hypothetical protein OXU64_05730 [Gemmatimonadota bacterium]|nr:hypothetical protein [Gemmatimonadota bacterium]